VYIFSAPLSQKLFVVFLAIPIFILAFKKHKGYESGSFLSIRHMQ
jgi:hypothetical protein